jgi:protein TonB
VHAAALVALVQASAVPRGEPERIVRVQLVPMVDAPAPGPPAPAAAPPAPERAAPPRRAVVRPAPRAPVPRPGRAPVAIPKPAEPASAAAPDRPGAESAAPAGGMGIDVASAPPGGGLGTGAGQVAGPGGGDEIAAYLARIHALLSRHQRYPAMARRRALEGSVLLQLRIGADGRIESARAERGAPKLFARSALDAVDRAGRLPAPPRGALLIELPLRFQLED